METSAIDAGNPFAAGKAKSGRPASDAFSDLLSTLFSKLGKTAEDDAALNEPFFQAKPRPAERPVADHAEDDTRADARRADRDKDDSVGYVDAAAERRAPVDAKQHSTGSEEEAAAPMPAASPAKPADKPAAAPAAPTHAHPSAAGNAAPNATPPSQIQVTVNEAPVQAHAGQKVAADAALATQAQAQAQAQAQDAETIDTDPRSAAPNANGQPAGKGDAMGANALGNQASGNNGQGQTNQQAGQQGFAALAQQMAQSAPAATAAAASGAASTFNAATATGDQPDGAPLPLGATGSTPAATAAAQRKADAAPSPHTPRLPAMEQIAINIQKAIRAGKDQVTIKLQPEELGRIDVKLEVGADGQVTAQVRAEKPETLELLQRDARGLERALQEAGLRTDSGSLSFGLRGENRQQENAFGQQGRTAPSPLALNAEQDDITPIIAARSAEGRIDLHV